jgi:alkanesulfonate monooxygenase SsuD/methylene tetrahydromethanopterin reductase-like flavin-dependent oxidoreductase (luciferase family)
MRVDTNFFGTVPMPDAGDPAIPPTSRRYGNADAIACYENMLHWAQTADAVGFDTMWLTEHHFQYRGLRGTPNLIMFGLYAATRRAHPLRQMFNVVPQWHPLRLAEDFAPPTSSPAVAWSSASVGARCPQAWALGTVVASGDNEMSAEHDRINREVFEESMEIIKLAWSNERFSYAASTSSTRPTTSPTAAPSSTT